MWFATEAIDKLAFTFPRAAGNLLADIAVSTAVGSGREILRLVRRTRPRANRRLIACNHAQCVPESHLDDKRFTMNNIHGPIDDYFCDNEMTETRCCLDADANTRRSPNRPRTSDLYQTSNLPERFDHPSWFYGYGIQRKPALHPCYRTTSSDYGRLPPSAHTVPTCFYPNSQRFSNKLLKAGMYRNYSLNTALDQTPF
ncbi:uncharacterized protein CBL_07496 [Carabus blaptoides fortunei]